MSMPIFPEGWRPSGPGDSVTGRVVSLEIGWSDQSASNYPIVIIDRTDAEGRVAVHGFHTALKTQLKAKKVRPGERVKITVGEKVPLKNNPSRSVVQYFVETPDRTAENFDANDFYSQISTDRDARPAPVTSTSDIPTGDDDIPF